ncbi:hypothetical protein MTBSS4_10150 [Magnetospirillum sp. SS-4]|nr:hypothetical protein MTBSS4_10150 [Magnetospirillum sp. SS-4]
MADLPALSHVREAMYISGTRSHRDTRTGIAVRGQGEQNVLFHHGYRVGGHRPACRRRRGDLHQRMAPRRPPRPRGRRPSRRRRFLDRLTPPPVPESRRQSISDDR